MKDVPKGASVNYTLYVVRLAASGLRQSSPCKHCLQAIQDVGIKKIVFSDDDGHFEIHTSVNYTTNHQSSGYRHAHDKQL